MTKKIFMSYSRRELGFVDDLVGHLEENKYEVWLDYRVLVPGSPWAEQIEKGLNEADTVLLVVSKASLGSEFVALEWRHFLETSKRVILCIFEAVDLPTELEKYEWVDFRGRYKAGLEELMSQLAQPIAEEHPVPESGFKAPLAVWGTVALSVFVAFLSLNVLWTIFVPLLLIPLPYQIFKRSFDFMRVQAALVLLPFTIALSSMVLGNSLYGQWISFDIFTDNPSFDMWFNAILTGLALGVWSWVLLGILRSPVMSRWGKPESTLPKFKNPYKPNISNPAPTPFFVEHVPEDRAVAADLRETMKKYGHPQAETIQDAKAVLTIISRFNGDTNASPSSQIVFPVIVQGNDNISKKLSKLQWIDFRPGVRGLDVIAQLLPEPTQLLKALGMRPVSSLSVYPPMITTLYYFMLTLAAIFIGAVADYAFFSGCLCFLEKASYDLLVWQLSLSSILLVVLTFFAVRGLLSRKGWFAKFPVILAVVAVQGLLMRFMASIDNDVYYAALEVGEDLGVNFATFGNPIFMIGLLFLIWVYFKNRADVRHWFPA
jgi:hypothetical protein